MIAVAGVVAMLSGCAGRPVLPAVERDPLDRPGTPQAVAIVVAKADPELSYLHAPGMALRGAGVGAGVGAPVFPPVGIVAGLLIGLAVGAAGEAAMPAPSVTPDGMRATTQQAIAELRVPDAIADRVVESARRFTPYRIEKVEGAGGAAGDSAGYRELALRGFGAVVELRVTAIGVVETTESDVAMFLAAEARLVDPTTGKPAWLRGIVHRSAARPPEYWVRDGGASLNRALGASARAVAERIVDDLLLHAESTLGIPLGTWASLPRPRVCGLLPVEPKPALSWEPPSAAVVDDTVPITPRLAWQPLPIPERAYAGVPAGRVRDPRYDLRIWSDDGGAPGSLVYERIGLERPEHVVETPLAPGANHFWSVRLRYDDEGHPRATRWSSQNLHRNGMPPALRVRLYHAHIENGVALPLPCGAGDEFACGCLDDVPVPHLYTFRTRAR